MSGLTLVGSGWHPALFRSEAEALVGPVGFVHPRVVVTTSTDEIALNRLSRSALVDEVLCNAEHSDCLLYTSPSPRDKRQSRMPSSA